MNTTLTPTIHNNMTADKEAAILRAIEQKKHAQEDGDAMGAIYDGLAEILRDATKVAAPAPVVKKVVKTSAKPVVSFGVDEAVAARHEALLALAERQAKKHGVRLLENAPLWEKALVAVSGARPRISGQRAKWLPNLGTVHGMPIHALLGRPFWAGNDGKRMENDLYTEKNGKLEVKPSAPIWGFVVSGPTGIAGVKIYDVHGDVYLSLGVLDFLAPGERVSRFTMGFNQLKKNRPELFKF